MHFRDWQTIWIQKIPGWLEAIRKGMPVSLDRPWDYGGGDVRIHFPDGFVVTIFNDAGEIDYIDSIERGGKKIDYNQLHRLMGNRRRDNPIRRMSQETITEISNKLRTARVR